MGVLARTLTGGVLDRTLTGGVLDGTLRGGVFSGALERGVLEAASLFTAGVQLLFGLLSAFSSSLNLGISKAASSVVDSAACGALGGGVAAPDLHTFGVGIC